jgi:NAD(P)H-dependent flavin oxidoreductase YrpB (nitropropane dioxygenase family)
VLSTRFTELIGCRLPVQLAAMGGGVTTLELVTEVSRAGGLGMVQRGLAGTFAQRLDAIARAAAGPFGVNFVPPLDQGGPDEVELAAATAGYVEHFWAEPDSAVVARVHEGGALAGWQVGSVEEARRAADAGCDLVVVQGVEAGGHVRGTIGLLALLAGTLEAVAVPVVAAGGIATPRAAAAAFAAGADGVRVGTRYLATRESGAHPDYVAAVLAAGAEDTVLTTVFAVGWPDAPHRVLVSAVAAVEAFTGETVGTLTTDEGTHPLPRFSARTPSRDVSGTVAAMPLYAGQGVGDVSSLASAAEITRRLAEGAEELLLRAAGLSGV